MCSSSDAAQKYEQGLLVLFQLVTGLGAFRAIEQRQQLYATHAALAYAHQPDAESCTEDSMEARILPVLEQIDAPGDLLAILGMVQNGFLQHRVYRGSLQYGSTIHGRLRPRPAGAEREGCCARV
jgi:hypothetical protein